MRILRILHDKHPLRTRTRHTPIAQEVASLLTLSHYSTVVHIVFAVATVAYSVACRGQLQAVGRRVGGVITIGALTVVGVELRRSAQVAITNNNPRLVINAQYARATEVLAIGILTAVIAIIIIEGECLHTLIGANTDATERTRTDTVERTLQDSIQMLRIIKDKIAPLRAIFKLTLVAPRRQNKSNESCKE